MNFCTLLLTPFPSVSCQCPRHEENRQMHCEGQLNADDKEGKSKSLGGRVTCRGHLRFIGPHRRQRPLATWSTSRASHARSVQLLRACRTKICYLNMDRTPQMCKGAQQASAPRVRCLTVHEVLVINAAFNVI